MRIIIIFIMMTAFGACRVNKALSQSKQRPNILFIAVDDLRPELGCYGNTIVQSPNIDNLARSGVLFSRAYCQQAVCAPSRVSLMTGRRPNSTRIWDLGTHFRSTIPTAITLPQHPFSAPKKYWDMYQREKFPLPTPGNAPEKIPAYALHKSEELRGYKDIGAEPISAEKQRELIHGYYASISYTDAQIGKVLAELDRLGLTNNTIIVLWERSWIPSWREGIVGKNNQLRTGYQSAFNNCSSRQKEGREV